MKKNRLFAQLLSGLLLATAMLSLTGCDILYHYPQYQYAGRTIPPSGLLQRVLVGYTTNGSSGGAVMLDGLRDTRTNIQDTIQSFPIGGYSGAEPTSIINFPEQQRGYIVNATDGTVASIDYATEKSSGTAATFGANPPSVAASSDGTRFVGAINGSGELEVTTSTGSYALNLPNVDKVVINQGNSVILAMVRNSDALYRIIRIPQTTTPVPLPGAVDCEPLLLPVYCVVPVPGTYDRPSNAYFSLDGTTAYVLNCGPECGGKTASVSLLSISALQVDNPCISGIINTTYSLCATTPPAAMQTLTVANPIPIPGGVTVALSDGNNLYLAGQQLQTTGANAGLFAGNLTVLPLTTLVPSAPISISDGTHTKILFADDNTLWIGSQYCASGVRAHQAALGITTQDANYNCLTRYVIQTAGTALCGSTNPVYPSWAASTAYTAGSAVCENNTAYIASVGGTSDKSQPGWNAAIDGATVDGTVHWVTLGPVTSPVQIVPSVTPNSLAYNVPYPNTNQNPVYYGDLNGLCWVQTYRKMYTGYGGQIHAFNTWDGSERDNTYITVQGTVLDVAYMDAITNNAD